VDDLLRRGSSDSGLSTLAVRATLPNAETFFWRKRTSLYQEKRRIRTTTGQFVPAVGIGNVQISIWIPGRGRSLVQLCHVLHVPEASTTNLISICPLSEKGIAMKIRNRRMELYKEGLLSAIVIRINQMFTLVTHEIPIDKAFVMSGNNNPQLTLWHKSFKQLHAHTILKLSSKQFVTGIRILQSTTRQH